MFDHLQTPEQIEAFLAEQRARLSEAEWRQLVHQLAEEMGARGENSASELLQKIKVYKRATDQLALPPEPEQKVASPKAQARGWKLLQGGRSPSEPR